MLTPIRRSDPSSRSSAGAAVRPPGPGWGGSRVCLGPAAVLASAALLAASLTGCNDRDPVAPEPPPEESLPPFRAAATCGTCHPQHFEEWKMSMHAFGGVDPAMLAGSEVATAEAGAAEGQSCRECHAPALVRQEEYLASLPPGVDPLIEDVSEDGVSCDVCHSISIVPPVGSIDFLKDVDPSGPKLGGISDPIPNSFHESQVDNSFRTSIQCAPCHQLALDNGTGVENTFQEWEDAAVSGMGIECQDCHMPAYTGPAAIGGPTRTVHRHTFVGVGYATEPFRGIDRQEQKDLVADLLRNSVQVDAVVPSSAEAGSTFTFTVEVTNDRTGHSIPSGTSFAREMWIEIEVRDAADALLYRSGWLEANGDLTTTDPDLASFGSRLLDEQGERTFFTWRGETIDESPMLQFNESREFEYAVAVPGGAVGPVSVSAALRFRSTPPAMYRELGLDHLLGEIVVFEMWSDAWDVTLP